MCVNSNKSDFNYTEFRKQLSIKDASDSVFEFSMWSYPCFDEDGSNDVTYKSYFLNKLKNLISHLIKIVDKYTGSYSHNLDIAIEIFNKTDVKEMYSSSFNHVADNNAMTTYIKTKTFINRLRVYITSKLYGVCWGRGYTAETCEEIDREVLTEITDIFYGC